MALHPHLAMFLEVASFALLAASAFAACPFAYREYVPGKCVQHYTDEKSYSDARYTCQRDGGDLISIHSQAENDAIFGSMPGGDSSWIGLQCDPDTRQYKWVDDTPLDYYGFDAISCNNKQNGFVMVQNSGMWRFGTDGTYHYSCGIDMGATDSRCDAGYQFEEETSMCLKVVKVADTWANAETSCNSDGGHLVSIHEQQTNAFIRQLAINDKLFDGIFVGLQVQPNGTFKWSDNTETSFSNFDVGMPNSVFGQCGAMLTRILEGQWVSVHCDTLTHLPYICAKPGTAAGSPCPAQNTFTDQGDIYSPGYPSSNAPSLTCEYFMAAQEGRHVLLEFAELSLTDGDSITLYEGESSANVIFALNNTIQPGGIYRTNSDNVLRMVYQAGPGNQARTWHAEFMTIF